MRGSSSLNGSYQIAMQNRVREHRTEIRHAESQTRDAWVDERWQELKRQSKYGPFQGREWQTTTTA